MGITIKKNDTYPAIEATLKQADGTAINLTGAAVKLIIKKTDKTTVLLNAAMTIVDAAAGKVKYQLTSAITAAVGLYLFEFEITFADTAKLTVPNDSFEELKIIDDLA